MDSILEDPQNINTITTTTQSDNSTTRCISKGNAISLSNRYLYFYVYHSTIYNSQDLESTWVSIREWMDKENTVYVNNRIVFSHEKERNDTICDNMEKPGGHQVKWHKPGTKRQIPHVFTHTWNFKKLIS